MNSFIVIFCYAVALSISMLMIARRYRVTNAINLSKECSQTCSLRMPMYYILIVDFLFVFCNYVATQLKPTFTGDRLIYSLNFQGLRDTPSFGLELIIRFLKVFTNNPTSLFYFSTFVTLLITFFAFNVCSDTTPYAYLFLFSTQYVFNTFSVLKQSYTNSFAVLCIVSFLEGRRNKAYYLLGVASLFFSILFHHTGYFLIPICVILCLKKTKLSVSVYSILMLFLFLYLDTVAVYIARMLNSVIPVLAEKITQYLGDNSTNEIVNEGLTYVKGLPFYMISVIGFIKRRSCINKINNYDNYLLLSIMLSFCYLTTIYNGWLYRFAYFFYLPVGVFFSLLLNSFKIKNNRIIVGFGIVGVALFLTFRFVVLMFINNGGF